MKCCVVMFTVPNSGSALSSSFCQQVTRRMKSRHTYIAGKSRCTSATHRESTKNSRLGISLPLTPALRAHSCTGTAGGCDVRRLWLGDRLRLWLRLRVWLRLREWWRV